jgi:hypothetical protein
MATTGLRWCCCRDNTMIVIDDQGAALTTVMIDNDTVVANRCDHIEGLMIIADKGWICFHRKGKCRIDCDLKIGVLTALFGKFNFGGGRRGSSVLDHRII